MGHSSEMVDPFDRGIAEKQPGRGFFGHENSADPVFLSTRTAAEHSEPEPS
jgi:hypothetical protein